MKQFFNTEIKGLYAFCSETDRTEFNSIDYHEDGQEFTCSILGTASIKNGSSVSFGSLELVRCFNAGPIDFYKKNPHVIGEYQSIFS